VCSRLRHRDAEREEGRRREWNRYEQVSRETMEGTWVLLEARVSCRFFY
jgi:hypothetical protein